MLGRVRTPKCPAQQLLGLQHAPRSIERSPRAVRCPVPIEHRYEAVLEACLGRGYVPDRLDLLILLFLLLY